jgi:hypothetical protein
MDPTDPLPHRSARKLAGPDPIRPEASQSQAPQDIYTTEVKRLLPGWANGKTCRRRRPGTAFAEESDAAVSGD